MTKRDYIRAAEIIRRETAGGEKVKFQWTETDFRRHLVGIFVAFFCEDNPRFDGERFRTAVEDGMIIERPGARPRPIGR